ncbi:MAG: hypothetical protein GF317_22600 [Candidatus Lokiarchaeota archaeon]|nr:hypothetical protein [Candidatus Lokiarchaeota archaeon]MBD3202252.1 hypothetical protein [Candidatus Lokiarchaeota archaeon]
MERIIIVHWNKSTGPEMIIQYPPEKVLLSKDLFLKVWAKHELNKEESMINYIPDEEDIRIISIIQKVEGEIYFLVLVYAKSENIDNIINDYPDIFPNIGKNLIDLINTNKITMAISEAFNTIKNYSKLEKEENLLNFFKDKIKFTILKILRDGVITKEDLKTLLKKSYGFSTINLDLILMSFIRENLIIKKNIPGSKDAYFLINDLCITRLPPQHPLKLFANFDEDEKIELLNSYKKELVEFYENYDCSQEDDIKLIINLVIDKNVFPLIKALREDVLSVNRCLNMLNNNEGLFNELLENRFIFEAKGYIFLMTDIRYIKYLPYYIVERLDSRYKQGKISINEFLVHLTIISDRQQEKQNEHYELI